MQLASDFGLSQWGINPVLFFRSTRNIFECTVVPVLLENDFFQLIPLNCSFYGIVQFDHCKDRKKLEVLFELGGVSKQTDWNNAGLTATGMHTTVLSTSLLDLFLRSLSLRSVKHKATNHLNCKSDLKLHHSL